MVDVGGNTVVRHEGGCSVPVVVVKGKVRRGWAGRVGGGARAAARVWYTSVARNSCQLSRPRKRGCCMVTARAAVGVVVVESECMTCVLKRTESEVVGGS